MKNQFVADILNEIADLLDIKGEIFFKTRAYRIAAQAIEVLEEDIEIVVSEDRLTSISGIGAAIAKKITEIVETGSKNSKSWSKKGCLTVQKSWYHVN